VSFTGATNPNTNNYNPSPTSVSVTQISSCGNVMTADVNAFALPPPTVGNVDALFLIDNSGSYGDDMPQIQAQAAAVTAKIQAAFPTARFGLATFRDFPFSPFGQSGDTAFQVVLPFTSNVGNFLTALAGIPSPDGGVDGPEAQYEAVFQALTGLGRDLDGDNIAGNSPGEIAPSSLGWVAGRHRLLYLLTDADFHDSDTESYPGTVKKAAGRNTVRSLISTTYPPSQLTVFTLIANEPGTFITQGEDGSLPPVDTTTLIKQADELGVLTGGGVRFVGPDSSGLDEAVDTSLSVLELSDTEPLCTPSSDHLCLNNGRFRVQAVWEDFQGNTGTGQAVSMTGDTGYFWFFNPANVELVVKVLDGRELNQKWWVFYGALSSVPYTLRVTDTLTGQTRVYANPSGHLASIGDTSALPDAAPAGPPAAAQTAMERFTPASGATMTDALPFSATCSPGATNLCLNEGRFKVEVEWKDFAGNTGLGQAVSMTGDTGYFWFFNPANVELVLKVLDGRPVNHRWWVFYGALSSVQYRITVTDTVTHKVKTYSNPSGTLASQADTSAFTD
jgi:hypothetical protein